MKGKRMRIFLTVAAVIFVAAACTETPQDEGAHNGKAAEPAISDAARQLPPGFLDEPPLPPTSDSLVLSGGTLITEAEIADAIVVVSDGKLVAWGKRGEVAVPDDSIGYDMRAKYIVPGTELDMQNNQLPVLAHLRKDAAATFLIIERFGSPEANLLGYLSGSELVVETDSD